MEEKYLLVSEEASEILIRVLNREFQLSGQSEVIADLLDQLDEIRRTRHIQQLNRVIV